MNDSGDGRGSTKDEDYEDPEDLKGRFFKYIREKKLVFNKKDEDKYGIDLIWSIFNE